MVPSEAIKQPSLENAETEAQKIEPFLSKNYSPT